MKKRTGHLPYGIEEYSYIEPFYLRFNFLAGTFFTLLFLVIAYDVLVRQ